MQNRGRPAQSLTTRFRRPAFFAAALMSLSLHAALSAAESAAVFSRYPEPRSGEYVVYRDYSWKNPTWTGFLCYDDSTWGAFTYTPALKSRVSVLFRTEEADGRLVLTGQQIISEITGQDVPMVNYLMALLPDAYGWRNDLSSSPAVRVMSSSGRSLLPPPLSFPKSLESFGGSVSLIFAPEIPLFNLRSLDSADGGKVLELYKAGRLGQAGDAEFFSLVPAEGDSDASGNSRNAENRTASDSSLLKIAKSAAEARTVDGVTLRLDGNWTMMADNAFFLGNSAVLLIDTFDIAEAGFPADELPLSLVRFFGLSGASTRVLPGSMRVSGSSKRFRIEHEVDDLETGSRNRDVKECIVSADGKKCTVVSLSVPEAVWNANEAYFKSLF